MMKKDCRQKIREENRRQLIKRRRRPRTNDHDEKSAGRKIRTEKHRQKSYCGSRLRMSQDPSFFQDFSYRSLNAAGSEFLFMFFIETADGVACISEKGGCRLL